MRVLFTTQPGFGHLNPLLPYAVALREAGHDVRFASAPAFEEAIARHGFPFHPIGINFTWEDATAFFPESVAAALAGRGMEFAIFEVTWRRWHPQAARDLLALYQSWRPDVVVREFAENGATFAGEASGVPVVCASWGALPTDRRSWERVWDWDRMLSCYVDLRHELGLAEDRPGQAWERQPTFSTLPPTWIGETGRDLGVRHFRAPPIEAQAARPPWLDSLGVGRPLVYATLGTVFNKLRSMRGAMLEAVAELDADVLMTVGRDVDPIELGTVPDNVRLESFVPQSVVLARASLVVSHAGLGTMLGAIYHGLPMVVIGIDGDQPVNAHRAAEVGVAVALERNEADAPAILDAANRVLFEPGVRAAARALKHECDSLPPIAEAVAALEDLVAKRPGLAAR